MTAQTKQELSSLNAHELHKIACAILGVDDEDHEFDEVSERVEEILVNMISGEVLSVLEELESKELVSLTGAKVIGAGHIESIKSRYKL